MMRNYMKLAFAILTGLSAIACEAADTFIAGLNPSERPANVPVITAVNHNDAWFRHALTGIERPHPPGLGFLGDQGNWHTPFNRPGTTGRYDIRGWHQPEANQYPE